MRVVLDTQLYLMQPMGGGSVYWYELTKRMIDDPNVELSILMGNHIIDNDLFVRLNLSNVDIIKEKFSSLNLMRLNVPKIRYSSPTIFHSSYLRHAKGENVVNVVTMFDFIHQKYMNEYHKRLNTLLKRNAIENADGIACISGSTHQDLLDFCTKGLRAHTKVIPLSASDDYYQMDDRGNDAIGHLLNRPNIPFILFVGGRADYKNFTFAIRLLERLPEFQLVMVGGGELTREEKASLEFVENRFQHVGRIRNEELNLLYNKAVCLLYPSLYEGFGIPILESMKAGCPVIAFRNSSIPEVLKGSGFLLENDDLEAALRVIFEITKEEYRKEVVAKQKAMAKSFSWDASYQLLIEFYRELLMSR